jgi:hypothetical protein
VVLVVMDCQILLVLVHLFSMLAAVVVQDTQVVLTEQEETVEEAMLDQLLL